MSTQAMAGRVRVSPRRTRHRAPPREGTLTFLFTDLVGSTALSTSLGDQAAQEHLRAHGRIVRECVEKHGGHEVRFIGDSFLVTFNGNLKAVSCAVDIQRRLTQHDRLHPDQGVQLRIGLNCGEAIREKGDYYGAAVNAAARICAAAEGGQVLVSQLVKDIIGSLGNLEFRDAGAYPLKGFPEPWRLYEVVPRAEASLGANLVSALADPTPFVGRDAELTRVKHLVETASEGRGGVTMLLGEPGVGKSRLAAEASAFAIDRGFTVVAGQCYEAGGPPAYGPFIEALRPLAKRCTRPVLKKLLGEGASWVAKLLPEVRDKLQGVPPTPPLPADQERHFLLESVVSFIVGAARRKPLLLILEDLHWSDRPTQLLLRSLIRVIANLPMVVVGTVRDIEVDAAHPLTETLTELHRQRFYCSLSLSGFGREGVRLMLLALAQQEPPAVVVDAVYSETEGNPFFVEEFIKLLLEEERLLDASGNWRSDISPHAVELPKGVSLAIERRLRRLEPSSRQTLTTAAVVGRVFRYNVLEAASELKGDALADAIDQAERAQLIRGRREEHGIQFSFAHELIRQTLYRELSLPRRERLHLRVAEAIERVDSGRLGEQAAALAHHFRQAGTCADARTTARYLILAGDQARTASAFEEAIRYYRDACERIPDGGKERAEALFKLGSAQRSAGDWSSAVASWDAAAVIYEALADAPGVERTCNALALLHGWRGQFPDALQAVQRGLTADPESVSEHRCRLLAAAATMLSLAGQPAPADALIEQAVVIAEKRDAGRLLGTVLATKGLHQRVYMEFADGMQTLARAEQLLREAGDLWAVSQCIGHQAIALHLLGRLAEMERRLDDLDAVATKMGDGSGIALLAVMRGVLAMGRGELGQAELWARQAEVTARTSAKLVLSPALHLIAEVQFLAGRSDRTEDLLREAARLHHEMGNTPAVHEGMLSVLLCRAFQGDSDGAQALLRHLPAAADLEQPITSGRYDGMITAAAALVMLGRKEQAAALYPPLLKMTERGVVLSGAWSFLLRRILGMIAAVNEGWDCAQAHYGAALQQAQELGLRKEKAEALYWVSRMLLERNAAGDRGRGRSMLERAIEGYRDVGMPKHLEVARQLLEHGCRG